MKCHVALLANERTPVQLWMLAVYVIVSSVCPRCAALYVTTVPGIVSVHRGNSATLRWAVDMTVVPSRPIRVLNGQGVELMSNYFGVTGRILDDSAVGDIVSRMDLVLSEDRTVIEVRFYNTQEADDGMYTLVIAATEDEGVRSMGKLLVYFAPEWRDYGGASGRKVYARLGDKNVTVNCSVAANPQPLYTWEYIEGPAPTSSPPGTVRPPAILVERSTQSWLTVDEVKVEDFGVYTCTATNTATGAYGERHHFVSVFNVTLVETVDSKIAATVAAILLPIIAIIFIIAFFIFCIGKRCKQGCSDALCSSCCCCLLQTQKSGAQQNKGDARYEDASVPLNQMHMHVMHHANNSHHGDYQQVSAYYYSTPYDYGMDRQQYVLPVPVPLPVLPGTNQPVQQPVTPGPSVVPVTLSSIAEEDDTACDSDENATPHHQSSSASACLPPPPQYAVAKTMPSHPVMPVRTAPPVPLTTKVPAPIPVPVPVLAPTVSPARMAPPKPARSALQDSTSSSPTSQSSGHSESTNSASHQSNTNGASSGPTTQSHDHLIQLQDATATTNGLLSSLKVTAGSSSPGSRSATDEVRSEVKADQDDDESSQLDNNNKTLSAFVDVIYADVTVHASMGGLG
jgi:hypothetical protein